MTTKSYDPKAGTLKVGLEERKKRFDRIKKTMTKRAKQEEYFMEAAWDFDEWLPEVPDLNLDEESTDDYYLLGVSRKQLYDKFGTRAYHADFAELNANERVQRMTFPVLLDRWTGETWCPCDNKFINVDDRNMDDTGNVFCSRSCCNHYGFHRNGGVS